jgi:hypothetical protein
MPSYEIKYCPRCLQPFECKSGNITQCQCFEVDVSPKDLELIKEMYDDCVCAACLNELKNNFKRFKEIAKLELMIKQIGEINGNTNQ